MNEIDSHFSTLDLLEAFCKQQQYKYLRFDGSTPSSQRLEIVDKFNSPSYDVYILLLSSKAGGVGLNLIGGSRLVLYDSDWNPATDLQAMARIWREGQKKNVHIYRLLSSGTIEEKIFQRQLTKTGLSESVVDINCTSLVKLSRDELKDLFTFSGNQKCLTHEILKCKCSGDGSIPQPEDLDESCRNEMDENNEENGGSHLIMMKPRPTGPRMNQLYHWEHHKIPIVSSILEDMQLKGSESVINFLFKNMFSQNADESEENLII